MSGQATSASGQLGSLGSAETPSRDGDFICETCRKIDFHDLLQNPRQATLPDARAPSPHTMRYSKGCKLCSLMFQNVPLNDIENTFELRSFSSDILVRWANHSDTNAPRNHISLKIGLQKPGFLSCHPYDEVYCNLASHGAQDLYCAQPVQRMWDCAKARLWLDTCARCHGSVCKQEVLHVPGMNLIDCEDMKIVEAAQDMRWLALSYVWGVESQSEDHAGYRAGSRVSSEIPETIRDAVTVTLQLGYRYLWVDEFCIDQNDDDHRKDQVMRMDQIYRGADLTIVAAAGVNKMHGLPGVASTKRPDREAVFVGDVVVFSNGSRPHDQIRDSEWFTRAWTFQEGFLSKRALVFTEHQMSFYCLASFWIEGQGNPDPNASRPVGKNYRPVHFLDNNVFVTSPTWNWIQLANLITEYSQRQIAKEVDTLDAFLGVTNHIRRLRPTTEFLRGLPFFKTSRGISEGTLIDSFEDIVTAALSWCSCDDRISSPQRKYTFPSWTWAGWSGAAEFWLTRNPPTRYQSVLRHARLESSSGRIVASSALYKSGIQRKLDTVTLIQFEAPMIPAASFSITESQWLYAGLDDDIWEGNPKFNISGRELSGDWYPDIYTFDQLIENVHSGKLSCFMLSTERCNEESRGEEDQSVESESESEIEIDEYSAFVLIVCWEADQVTAQRIGSFRIWSDREIDARLGPLEENWTWRRVRLI